MAESGCVGTRLWFSTGEGGGGSTLERNLGYMGVPGMVAHRV